MNDNDVCELISLQMLSDGRGTGSETIIMNTPWSNQAHKGMAK